MVPVLLHYPGADGGVGQLLKVVLPDGERGGDSARVQVLLKKAND